jgi:pimeloyl-ACP methyl ester carboxylesterase
MDASTQLLRVVCLPGFGDPAVGERWVGELSRLAAGLAVVEAIDWPGLWTRCDEPVSFTALAEQVAEDADESTVLVGHSLGGRVALQVASAIPVAGVVAACSPTKMTVNEGPAAQEWVRTGSRLLERTAPNGVEVSYRLPVSFLHELNDWLDFRVIPEVPTLMLFGDRDRCAAPGDWDTVPRLGAEPQVKVLQSCSHRFMDDPANRRDALHAIAWFLRDLAHNDEASRTPGW